MPLGAPCGTPLPCGCGTPLWPACGKLPPRRKKTVAFWPSATDEALCAAMVATTNRLPPDFVTLAVPIADCVRLPRVAVAITCIAVGVPAAAGVFEDFEPHPARAAASAARTRTERRARADG